MDGLNLPEWIPGFAVVLLMIGLPIVLATAFVQEGIDEKGRAIALNTAGKRAPPYLQEGP